MLGVKRLLGGLDSLNWGVLLKPDCLILMLLVGYKAVVNCVCWG